MVAGRERQHLGPGEDAVLGEAFCTELAVGLCSVLHNTVPAWRELCLDGGAPLAPPALLSPRRLHKRSFGTRQNLTRAWHLSVDSHGSWVKSMPRLLPGSKQWGGGWG